MDKKNWKAEFYVTGLDEQAVDKALDAFIAAVEAGGGDVGGGIYPDEAEEAENEQA